MKIKHQEHQSCETSPSYKYVDGNNKICIKSKDSTTILFPSKLLSKSSFEKVKDKSSSKKKGVIQFVGGFLSSSYPNGCKLLLEKLCEEGYVVVIYNFPSRKPNNFLRFDHIKFAHNIIEQRKKIKKVFPEILYGYNECKGDYHWLAYSLGCKLLIFLELLSSEPRHRTWIFGNQLNYFFKESEISTSKHSDTIRNQSAIFMAPEIVLTYGDDESEEQIYWLKFRVHMVNSILNGLDRMRFIFPNRQVILDLMRRAFKYNFNISKVIAFNEDDMSKDDVREFIRSKFEGVKLNFKYLNENLEGYLNKASSYNYTDFKNAAGAVNLGLKSLKCKPSENVLSTVNKTWQDGWEGIQQEFNSLQGKFKDLSQRSQINEERKDKISVYLKKIDDSIKKSKGATDSSNCRRAGSDFVEFLPGDHYRPSSEEEQDLNELVETIDKYYQHARQLLSKEIEL